MARPLSEEKRDAILDAACRLVATVGTGAPTAQIAREAGLAEGTLFKYFGTKDDLLNQLYLSLKTDLAHAMLTANTGPGDAKARLRQVWDGVIDWGARDPSKRKAVRQLAVSERITPETRRKAGAPFKEVSETFSGVVAQGRLKGQPEDFIAEAFEAMADLTLEYIQRDPARLELHKRNGFELLWGGIAP